jgi:hypothetical protein
MHLKQRHLFAPRSLCIALYASHSINFALMVRQVKCALFKCTSLSELIRTIKYLAPFTNPDFLLIETILFGNKFRGAPCRSTKCLISPLREGKLKEKSNLCHISTLKFQAHTENSQAFEAKPELLMYKKIRVLISIYGRQKCFQL